MPVVSIHPLFNAFYYSFYIDGLQSVVGRSNLRYVRPFVPGPKRDWLVFTVAGTSTKRIVIDAYDNPAVNQELLQWCDVYAKVNLTPNYAEGINSKLFPIGPSFATRCAGPVHTMQDALQTYLLNRSQLSKPREHFADYLRQYRYRIPERHYSASAAADPKYVFFMATLWKKEPEINHSRAAFISACKSLPLQFEGGFVRRADMNEFTSLTVERRYSLTEYLNKMRLSALAFNTSGVMNCLGWKLAEFLALGKAIISTPLERLLPAPLEHTRHVHYVDGTRDTIVAAIELLTRDTEYRRRLETNAREYYHRYLSPSRVIQRIFTIAGVS